MKALYLSAVLLFLATPLFRYSSAPPVASDSPSQVQFNPCCSWWHRFSVTVQPLLLLVTPLLRYSPTPRAAGEALLRYSSAPPAAGEAPSQVQFSPSCCWWSPFSGTVQPLLFLTSLLSFISIPFFAGEVSCCPRFPLLLLLRLLLRFINLSCCWRRPCSGSVIPSFCWCHSFAS